MKFPGFDKLSELISYPTCYFDEIEIYRGRICNTMRKDKIKEGYVARTFHLKSDTDKMLKIRAANDGVRFSDIVEAAIENYLKRDRKKNVK